MSSSASVRTKQQLLVQKRLSGKFRQPAWPLQVGAEFCGRCTQQTYPPCTLPGVCAIVASVSWLHRRSVYHRKVEMTFDTSPHLHTLLAAIWKAGTHSNARTNVLVLSFPLLPGIRPTLLYAQAFAARFQLHFKRLGQALALA